jgi:hypothetical protein
MLVNGVGSGVGVRRCSISSGGGGADEPLMWYYCRVVVLLWC